MLKKDFQALLKKACLKQYDFAIKTEIPIGTINNWNDRNRQTPNWVKTWLDNYIKAKLYYDLKDRVFEIENLNNNQQKAS